VNPVAVILRAVQIVRGWGIVVTFEPGWETRGNGYISRWVGVIVHHTGTPSSLSNPFPTRRLLREGRSNLSGPLCNSAGPADGSIHVMAAQAANHAGASGGRSMGPLPVVSLFNPRVFGHEIDYAGAVPMLLGQYRAAALWSLALLIALKEAGQIPTADPQRARAHAETSITGKWDPGFADGRTIDMNAFRAAVAAGPQPEDDVELTDKIRFWDGKEITVGQALSETWQLAADTAGYPTREGQPATLPAWVLRVESMLTAVLAAVTNDPDITEARIKELMAAAVRENASDPLAIAAQLIGPLREELSQLDAVSDEDARQIAEATARKFAGLLGANPA